MRKLFLSLVCIFSASIACAQSLWTHLELGGGNYGADGHSKQSQAKTVLQKLSVVTDAANYIDGLDEAPLLPLVPEEQYSILFDTLDQLVARHGGYGVFHINDLVPEYAEYAAERLQEYAAACAYTEVIIAAIPGDYTLISPVNTLQPYGLDKYDSVHLKNPEISFYNYGMDGDQFLSSPASRMEARILLQTLADFSHAGLYFFPVYHPNFIPEEEVEEFFEKETFYKKTTQWDTFPYVFPEGRTFLPDSGAVFFIPASACSSSQA